VSFKVLLLSRIPTTECGVSLNPANALPLLLIQNCFQRFPGATGFHLKNVVVVGNPARYLVAPVTEKMYSVRSYVTDEPVCTALFDHRFPRRYSTALIAATVFKVHQLYCF
jgi:hypothetical protein